VTLYVETINLFYRNDKSVFSEAIHTASPQRIPYGLPRLDKTIQGSQ
jgi:hypothetical protein